MCDYCSWIDQILAKVNAESQVKKPPPVDPVIIVHGGAGKIPRKERSFMLREVKNAAVSAYSELIKGRSAVDAVEKAIAYMESRPYFNCAKGGSLDANEEVVMDAALVSSNGGGFVGAVRDIEHPITLARTIMENTDHLLIVDTGAQKFALEAGIPVLPPGYLNAKSAFESTEYLANQEEGMEDHEDSPIKLVPPIGDTINECVPGCLVEDPEGNKYCQQDTSISESLIMEPSLLEAGAVGAVAYDRKRRFASGTSTAGTPGKPVGNVSATATVIGCGVYADKNGCVSVSGEDRAIYYYAPARTIIRKLDHDRALDTVIPEVLEEFVKETGESCIGAIALNCKGQTSVSFKSMHFPWAICDKGFVYYGCKKNEKLSEEIKTLERTLDCMCEDADEH